MKEPEIIYGLNDIDDAIEISERRKEDEENGLETYEVPHCFLCGVKLPDFYLFYEDDICPDCADEFPTKEY